MLSARTRRATAAGATALTALVTAGLTALPAQAAAGALTITGQAVYALPTDGTTQQVRMTIADPQSAKPQEAKVTIDTSALAGIATVQTSAACTTQGSTVTCDESVGPNVGSQLELPFQAVKTAKPGTSAKLHLTATTPDGGSASFDTVLTVGGTQLSVKPLPAQHGLKVGSTITTGLDITNNGSLASTQTTIEIYSDTALPMHQYGNCLYDHSSGIESIAICTVNTGIAPGETVHLDPVQFDVTSQALGEDIEFNVSPQPVDLTGFPATDKLVQGSGPRLTLGKPESPAPVPSTVAELSQNNGADLQVSVDNSADFVALGSWQPQSGGKQGTLQVGLRNDGPAMITSRAGSSAADLQVILPAGVKVTTVPNGCTQAKVSDPAGRTLYRCDTKDTQLAGFKITFDFGVQVDDPTAVRNGLVDFVDGEAPSDFAAADKLSFDPNPANNSVQLAFGAQATASPTPSTAAAAPATSAPAVATTSAAAAPARTPSAVATPTKAAGTSQDLAFTGGGSNAGAIAAVGGGVILLGAGSLFYANRRRKAADQG
ncbi:hypothetical protein OG455_22680 [Kitasatospora sp. NBC_01287]|uniref:hypothetical protein n=1 Tax=Kitasatospora sp. NBC_01287 TaxID=2903573 RepID=UPI0022572F36|nr:hypothetical protein [Kitasatospora sp. NBC_01287]MCX4748284.1 hypothetical protein [Kitasatospora sp. NBC_01287]